MLPLCPWAVGGGLKRGWAGLSCAPRTLRGQKAGLEWHCQGVLSSEALPQCPGALWKSLPAVLTLCRGSALSDRAQNQAWKRPTRWSSPTVWHCFSLTRIWLLLTRWNFLSKLTLTIPSLRTFLRGMGQIWNTLSVPNSLPCAMQRLLWCSAFRF